MLLNKISLIFTPRPPSPSPSLPPSLSPPPPGACLAHRYSQIEKVDDLEPTKPPLSTGCAVYCDKSYMHSLINFKDRLLLVVHRTRDCSSIEETLN